MPEIVPGAEKVVLQGPASGDLLFYRFQDAKRVVRGKTMKTTCA